MPTTSFDKDSIKASIIGKLQRYNGRTIEEASNGQIYRALASTVRDQIMQKWMISREERKTNNNKRLFYLSVEFLMGRSLYTNILNLVSLDAYKQALDELHIDVDKVLQEEPEPALGNGGLGRLAACFMDSLASLRWAAPSAMNTVCSARRLWTVSRSSCRTTGWATATCGKCP